MHKRSYDHPAVFFDSSDLSFQLWPSCCILRLVRPQPSTSIIQLHSTTRPTSAFNFDHPAAFYDSTYASYPQLTSSCAHLRLNYTSYQRYHPSWRPYSTITDLTHVCRSDNKLSFVIFVGVWRYLGGQGLRARLCCRKISDSIFWLYYYTPRWLAGAMPCPKKVQKKYTKRKDRNR